ncbi:MAG: site-specific integrase [Gammaproteobacteria bacterium]|nr:site-specific integrase [Gammaproteobacteria bacterium]
MASFIQRPGPRGRRVWQVKIRRRGWPAQSATFDSKVHAEAWARQIEGEMDRGVFVSRSEAEGTTLADALDWYERDISSKKKSSAREAYAIRWWRVSPLASRTLASIRGKDIAASVAAMSSHRERRRKGDEDAPGLRPNTIRIHLALLSHLFNVARTAWGMESLSNPVDLVKGQRPKLPQGRDRRLQGGEQARLLAAAQAYGGEVGPIITWAIETAMRRGEIAAMRWDHLDRKAKVLLIPETKNGTPRRVPLSTAALAVLDGLSRRLDGRVWGMRPDSISQAFERVCGASGVEGLTFHDLRHEATSRLFEKGLNPMEVAAITGHKTLQMLKRYTHLRAEDLVERLG